MKPPESMDSEKRREGRRMACEALLAARFGRRPTASGARALARLRAEAAGTQAPQAGTDVRQSPVVLHVPWSGGNWLALAASIAVLLAGVWMAVLHFGKSNFPVLEAQSAGVMVEREGRSATLHPNFLLRPGDVVRTPLGVAAQVKLPRNAGVLHLRPNAVLEVRAQDAAHRLVLSNGTLEGNLTAEADDWDIETPHALIQRAKGQFVVAARMTSTWLGVEAGSVDISTQGRGEPLHLVADEYAVAVPGLRLDVQSLSQPWRTPYAGMFVAASPPPM